MELLTEKKVRLLCFAMAGLFLLIHVGMFIIFAHCRVTPMVAVNVGSIIFYVVMFRLIRRDHLKTFVVATFLEITAHMGLAIIYTGWDAGFQICLIGICVLLFYAEYVGRSMKMERIHSIFLAPVAGIVYLSTLVISMTRPAQYVLPDKVEEAFQIFWAVIVFAIMLLILQVFVFVAIRSQEELSSEAMHDKLTGLPNRYYVASLFPRIMSNTSWIAIADLDDFKMVNDTYGHNCGDYILKTIAGILREQEGIEICRWGGEEFLLVGGRKNADVLEAIRKRVEDYLFNYQGLGIRMTVTIGMAWYQDGQSIDEWINAADEHLYEGKRTGKNRVCQ